MEAAELAQKQEAIRLWAEAEERRRQEFERERDARAGVTQAGAWTSGCARLSATCPNSPPS
jgi:hypothetical protein